MANSANPTAVLLPGRGLIHAEGVEACSFLNNLLTANVPEDGGTMAYAALLSPQGKFLHDLFIRRGDGHILLECEGGERARDLYNCLNRYRLRAKVTISLEENWPVYVVSGSKDFGLPDPRHPALGRRALDKPALPEGAIADYHRRRIALGIPDGSRDIEIGGDTAIEAGLDRLGGIDFKKGCYVGQEVTARMHYRGLAKNRLRPVRWEGPDDFAPGTDIRSAEGALIGTLRGTCEHTGLAMIKDRLLDRLDETPFRLLDEEGGAI